MARFCPMKKAIFYLSYNGIFSHTNGVGTQAKTFLQGMVAYRDTFKQQFGDFDVHAITHVPATNEWGYSHEHHLFAQTAITSLGGKIHYCPYNINDNELWSVEGWRALSTSASAIILEAAHIYDEIFVIATDVQFAQTARIIENVKE